jgi:hypothetical protein
MTAILSYSAKQTCYFSHTQSSKGVDMAGNAFSRETIRLTLMGVMGVCLALTVAIGTATLVWSAPPFGDTLRLVASVFAWLFAGALLIAFFLAIVDERTKGRARPAGYVEGPKL